MEKTLKKYFPLFVLPTLAAFIIGFIVPFAEGIYLSFCKFTTVGNASWVGVSNYVKAFSDATFRSAFWFTLGFTAVSTILINVLAFAIALLLTRGIKGTNVFRTVFFMPNLIGGIVLGYIWQILINCVLSLVKQPLLQLNTAAGYWGLIILMCWQQVGYMMIIYIAGLERARGPYRGCADRRREPLAGAGAHQAADGHVLRHHMPVPVADELIQAVRPEPFADRRRTQSRLRDAGPEHL